MTASNGIAGGVGLLPCPFCGGRNIAYVVGDQSCEYTTCDDCLADGPIAETQDDAVIAWNTRLAAPAEVDARVEAMAGAMFDDWMGDDVGLHSSPPWPELDDDIREQWRSSARAALRALSAQPTGGE